MSNLYFVNICIPKQPQAEKTIVHHVILKCGESIVIRRVSENLSVSIQRQLTVIVGHDAREIILHQMN